MFKFLFGRRGGATPDVVAETQRQTLTRALEEVNEIIALLDPRPAITVAHDGQISLDLPEQMPDEALALPAPATPEGADTDAGAAPGEPADAPSETSDTSDAESEAEAPKA